MVTCRREPFFRDGAVVHAVEEALRVSSERHSFAVLAYCFMPDHAHLLVAGDEVSRLTSFVHLFKQLSGFRARQLLGTALWQTSYYDHVLRREEDVAEVARYIWGNPVRAGLASDPADYAFSGPRRLLESVGQA